MGSVKAVYPGDGDPDAVPGVCPEPDRPDREADVPSFTLEVDGELFVLRPDQHGGIDYTWVSGPNPGYGFALSPARNLAQDEHRQNIRTFLADIDPSTGYLTED
jgi:hypothetical protein